MENAASSLPSTENVTSDSGPASEHLADSALLAAPAGKLDADNYNAEDLDGVTENAHGSGNLNYLMMQARQTNLLTDGDGTDNARGSNSPDLMTHLLASSSANHALMLPSAAAAALASTAGIGGNASSSSAGPLGFDHASGPDHVSISALSGGGIGNGGSGFLSNATAYGHVGTDESIQNTTVTVSNPTHDGANGSDGAAGNTGNSGNDGSSGANGSNGMNGSNGANGSDGGDGGHSGGGDPGDGGHGNNPPDVDLSVHNDVGLPQVDINLDPIEHLVGDIDVAVGLTHGADGVGIDLGAVVAGIPLVNAAPIIDLPLVNPVINTVLGDLSPVLHNLTDGINVNNILHDPVGTVADTVGDLLHNILSHPDQPANDVDLAAHNNLGLPELNVNLDPVENIVGDIDILTDVTHGANGLTVDVSALAANIPLVDGAVNLSLPELNHTVDDAGSDLQSILAHPADLGAALGDASHLLQDAGDAVSNIGGSLLHQDNSPSDTDISVHNDLGLPQVDVNLNPVESITGDIDLGVGITHSAEGIDLSLDTVVASVPVADLNVPLDIPLVSPVLNDALNDIAPLTQSLDPAHLADALQNPVATVGDTVHDLLSSSAPAPGADTDLSVHNDLGLPQVDVNLDPIENITGDIDLGVGITHSADGIGLSLDGVVAGIPVADITLPVDIPVAAPILSEALDGVSSAVQSLDPSTLTDALSGSGIADTVQDILGVASDAGNTGGSAPIQIGDVLDQVSGALQTATSSPGDILPDTVSSILNVAGNNQTITDGAANLLSSITDTVSHAAGGATDTAAAWPQTDSAPIADTLGSIVSTVTGGLPDPSGSITEGLGILSSGSDHGGGLLSGLTHGHHGGLLG